MKKTFWIACLSVFVLINMFIFHKYLFLKIELTDNYCIKQIPFCNRYNIYHDNKKVVDDIYEWIENERYIYGYARKDFYIYDKARNCVERFESVDEWNLRRKELSLNYSINDYNTVLDYKTGVKNKHQ